MSPRPKLRRRTLPTVGALTRSAGGNPRREKVACSPSGIWTTTGPVSGRPVSQVAIFFLDLGAISRVDFIIFFSSPVLEAHRCQSRCLDLARSRLKVQRAYRHIQEIQAVIAAFVRTDFCKLRIDENLDLGSYSSGSSRLPNFHPKLPLPSETPFTILRTSLDYVTTAIVGKTTIGFRSPMHEATGQP